MQFYRWWKRIGSVVSPLSDLGTFVVALLAVILYFSHDLEHENQRLISEKVDLMGQRIHLDLAVADLKSQQEQIQKNLDTARSVERTLNYKIAELSVQSSKRQIEVAKASNTASQLKAKNTALLAENTQIAGRVIPTLLLAYLPALHPNSQEVLDLPEFDFLYDTEDPGFRSVTGGDIVVFNYVVIADTELREKDAPPEHSICSLPNKFDLFGFTQKYSTNSSVSIQLADLRTDIVFENLCAVLAQPITLIHGKSTISVPLYEALKRQQHTIVFKFFAGTLAGRPWEEIRARAFWSTMFGEFYQKELQKAGHQLDDDHNIDAFSQGRVATYSFADLVEDVRNVSNEHAMPGYHTILDQSSKFNIAWSEYLKGLSFEVRGNRAAIMKGDEFIRSLPRIKANDLSIRNVLDDRSLVTNYIYQLNCSAVKFAVDKEYVAKQNAPEYDFCKSMEKAGDYGGALGERLTKQRAHEQKMTD